MKYVIIFPSEEPSRVCFLRLAHLTIVYEDEALIIVNKPAGQSTIPSRDHPDGTMANVVAGKFAHERSSGHSACRHTS